MPVSSTRYPTILAERPCSRSMFSALLVSATIMPQGAFAQSATPGATEEIVVIAPRSPVVARLNAAAGGTAIVSADSMAASANLTISRALADVPGVVVQDFFGGDDQPQLRAADA